VKKAATKPAPKAVAKPAAKPVTKPIAQPAAKPVAKAVAPVKPIAPAKPVAPKPVVEKIIVAEPKQVAKPEVKPAPTQVTKKEKIEPIKHMPDVRYSDQDLKEFEELIIDKVKQAKADLEELRQSLSHNGDNSTDDTSPTFKMMEDGSDTMNREELANLASRQEKFIQNLDNALLRIKNKTYGICRVTGKLIPKERLRLVPHATLSIEAKNSQN
jgi:RNA polymerase-binding transcription factor DksA